MSHKLPAYLSGRVTPYKGNGRKLGYPTANIDTTTNLDDGVYFGYAEMSDYRHWPALIFIGTPTTLGDKDRRVEAYLFDAIDKDYYGEKLELKLVSYHRPNQTFESIDALLQVMHQDEKIARGWFARQP
ncbi:MAG TPA: riboflavin kinase [Candidatus Saccharimonadales bacterium]|nr:riboflavin kinase [Candidatus Saccharimonadales bacterium]